MPALTSKHLLRLMAVFLIPALLQEPLLAAQAQPLPAPGRTQSTVTNRIQQEALTAVPLWQHVTGHLGHSVRVLASGLQTRKGQVLMASGLLLADYLWPNHWSQILNLLGGTFMMTVADEQPLPDIRSIESMKRIVQELQPDTSFKTIDRTIHDNKAITDHATAWYLVARASQLVDGVCRTANILSVHDLGRASPCHPGPHGGL